MRARRVFPCAPGAKFLFSMAHLGPKHRSPLRKSFIPSRRQSRQTGPRYLANFFISLNTTLASDSSPFRRPAAVVRNRGHVADGLHLNSRRLERPDAGPPPRAGSLDSPLEALAAERSRRLRRLGRRLLGGERSSLAGTLEALASGARPAHHVAFVVGDGDGSVVERRLDVRDSRKERALFLLLEGLALALLFFLGFFLRHPLVTSTSSSFPCAGPCGSGSWYGSSGRGPEARGDAEAPDSSRYPSAA